MAGSVVLPGIGEKDSQRTEVAVRQLARQVQDLAGTGTPAVTSVAGKTGTVTLVVADVSGVAPLASPAFTGTPTAPTPATSDNSTTVATTAYVKAQGSGGAVTSVAGKTGVVTLVVADVSGAAPLASPALTGTPTAPTPSAADNSTKIATTAYVDAASSPSPWTLAKKTADQSVTSSTTFADDNDLKFSVAANSVYKFRASLVWNNGVSSKQAFNGPSGGTLRVFYANTGTAVTTAYDTLVNAPPVGITIWVLDGTLQTGATAGTFALRIAQLSSSATASVLEKGSILEWTKIS